MPSARSTVHGHVDSFKRLLDTFISELDELESTGLPNPDGNEKECKKVTAVVNNAAQHLLASSGPLSMADPYGVILQELAEHYRDWNLAHPDEAHKRKDLVEKMRQARRKMPKRKSWGPGIPVQGPNQDFLIQIPRHFADLKHVAGPEFTIQVKMEYRLDTRTYEKRLVKQERAVKRLPSGECMAFPRTSKQALRRVAHSGTVGINTSSQTL
jgi:hypothetical protein